MGIFTDFVIAGRDEGEAIGRSQQPAEAWPTYSSRNVDTIMLARLFCCATGAEYGDELQASFPIVGGNDENLWVLEFPENLLTGIAGIEPGAVPAVAAAWARTDELRRWTLEAATEFVANLAGHAKRAVDEGSTLYVWIAL